MRHINIATWPRREHFKVFNNFDYPHFGLCANMDLTTFLPFIREHHISFTIAVVYLLTRVANSLPEFRYRIRGENVVEHEVVHPSFTVQADTDLFSFCTVTYDENFTGFSAASQKQMSLMKERPTLKDEPGQDDLLFMSSIPWVSFTSFLHPVQMHPVDSVPRIVWGKFFEEGKTLKMPLGVQAHHALMDGYHMGKFYDGVQEGLEHPDFL